MYPLQELTDYLDQIFPAELAASWDNVGLLVGDSTGRVKCVLTCLTVTPQTVAEAIQRKANVIVSHHPFPFHASKRWTTQTPEGRMLLDLISNHIAIYSPHTAHDSAMFGINEQLAAKLGLKQTRSLYPGTLVSTASMGKGAERLSRGRTAKGDLLGTGRIGLLPKPMIVTDFIELVRNVLGQSVIQAAFTKNSEVRTIAIGCGAADEFVDQAVREQADLLLLGEARFHSFLSATEQGMALVAPGHYATERFAMEVLARRIAKIFPKLEVCPADSESDPVKYFF
ncbi:MAG: Nif3-like dinuclear metal center hexameric protein [Thermoguttaceae bacterium]|nr:Nif3-like dinuclear metal center hexameric protein [Thermoguttaceae bacterium]